MNFNWKEPDEAYVPEPEPDIFQVELADGRVVYMKRPTWEKTFSNGIVVYLDPEQFSQNWHDFNEFRKRDNKRDKEKYQKAERCLLNSLNDPVPMAEFGIGEHKRTLGISAGATRTVWLIENGAKALPLCCHPSELEEIKKLVSIKIASSGD